MTASIYAQSDWTHSYGDMALDSALARYVNAVAVDKELDNWVKQVRSYWERKTIREEKLLEMKQYYQTRTAQYLNNQECESRAWDRLKNHPQLTHVETGEA